MSGKFVRASKFRHVFAQPSKREQCYDNVKITRNAWDSNLIQCNSSYLSINWNINSGGSFGVIPLNETGKIPESIPLFQGHTAPVLDTDWSPFMDTLVASGSEDAKIFLWQVPDDFTIFDNVFEEVRPMAKLTGHSRHDYIFRHNLIYFRKVGFVQFHPTANNVLASASTDGVKFWDIEKGVDNITLKHQDIIQSMSFNRNGSLLVTTCRDKMIRIFDPRAQISPVQEAKGHEGAKNSRVVWLGDLDRIATTGFGKYSGRQLGLFDTTALGKGPISHDFIELDSSSGITMPFWDPDTKILYLAGKGDGNIRYYELDNDEFCYLADYKSTDPQRGMAFMPKRSLAIHENEIARAYKSSKDVLIEPIRFYVPRRSETYQDDIYPDTLSDEPSLTAGEWFAGKTADPILVSLEQVYEDGLSGRPAAKSACFTPSIVAQIPRHNSFGQPSNEKAAQAQASSPVEITANKVSRNDNVSGPANEPYVSVDVQKLTEMIRKQEGSISAHAKKISSLEDRLADKDAAIKDLRVQVAQLVEAFTELERGGVNV
ncbi:Coronin-like protein crn1 [Neolecta irregularis DAH-3]|uniref:Coronin n=1 Tax=Neolecta irregularis (strain DAH-3) TaxID=1198029 RepID=A0A1U7LUM7_NEOID|nr:Coronin-like protein crn1 [Neolecta irregularis DAH-3]|eukprot:OLL26329.1 Coronin-like protein crn1 [Neolecta irregularis DAH-3]